MHKQIGENKMDYEKMYWEQKGKSLQLETQVLMNRLKEIRAEFSQVENILSEEDKENDSTK
jgi:hypothetical protein